MNYVKEVANAKASTRTDDGRESKFHGRIITYFDFESLNGGKKGKKLFFLIRCLNKPSLVLGWDFAITKLIDVEHLVRSYLRTSGRECDESAQIDFNGLGRDWAKWDEKKKKKKDKRKSE